VSHINDSNAELMNEISYFEKLKVLLSSSQVNFTKLRLSADCHVPAVHGILIFGVLFVGTRRRNTMS
jgi:hypothetical protein